MFGQIKHKGPNTFGTAIFIALLLLQGLAAAQQVNCFFYGDINVPANQPYNLIASLTPTSTNLAGYSWNTSFGVFSATSATQIFLFCWAPVNPISVVRDFPLYYFPMNEPASPIPSTLSALVAAVTEYSSTSDATASKQSGSINSGEPSVTASLNTCVGLQNGAFIANVTSADGSSVYTEVFTLEFWFKPASSSFTNVQKQSLISLVGANTATYGAEMNLALSATSINVSIGGQQDIVTYPIQVCLNTWTHYAVTYNRWRAEVRLYLNATLVARSPVPPQDPSSMDPYPLSVSFSQIIIGSSSTNGWIDELALYSRFLGPARVLQHFRAATDSNFVPSRFLNASSVVAASGYLHNVSAGWKGAVPFTVERVPTTTAYVKYVDLDPNDGVNNKLYINGNITNALPNTTIILRDKYTHLGGGTYPFMFSPTYNYLVITNKTNIILDGNGIKMLTGCPNPLPADYECGGTVFKINGGSHIEIRNFTTGALNRTVGQWAKLVGVFPNNSTLRIVQWNLRTNQPQVVNYKQLVGRALATYPKTFKLASVPSVGFGSFGILNVTNVTGDYGTIDLTIKLMSNSTSWGNFSRWMNDPQGQGIMAINNYANTAGHIFAIFSATHITLNNIHITDCGSMVSSDWGCDYCLLLNSKVALYQGQTFVDKPFIVGADILHAGSHLVVENSEFWGSDDDVLSLKGGSSGYGVTPVAGSNNSVNYTGGWYPDAGDMVELRGVNFEYTGVVLTVAYSNDTMKFYNFTTPIPHTNFTKYLAWSYDFVVSNKDHIFVRYNWFHDLFGRFLLYLPNTTFTNNEVSNIYTHFGATIADYEDSGYGVYNLLFKDNVIESFSNSSAVDTGVWGWGCKYPIFNNLLFQGNSFLQPNTTSWLLNYNSSITFSNNNLTVVAENYFETGLVAYATGTTEFLNNLIGNPPAL